MSVGTILMGMALTTNAYDIVDRYKITEDRQELFEMLDPYEHDFIFETKVMVN